MARSDALNQGLAARGVNHVPVVLSRIPEEDFQRPDAVLAELRTWAGHPVFINTGKKLAMKNIGALTVSTPSDREIVMTRIFDAPRTLVFEAFTRPDLIKRWLTGPPGWSLEVCEMDLRVGGAYRYEWHNTDGRKMGMGGVIREVEPPERLVTTEKFDDAWYPGEMVGTVVLTETGGTTMLTQTLLYDSREARDIALTSGMDGVAFSYDQLAALVASMSAPAGLGQEA